MPFTWTIKIKKNPHGPGPKSALARLTEKNLYPTAIQPYVTCDTTTAKCTETIPGYFKMRTKFTDFTGRTCCTAISPFTKTAA